MLCVYLILCINIEKFLFSLHISIANNRESATAFVFFIIEIAFDNNGIAFGRVLFWVLAGFRKFKGESLRTAGECIGNDAAVKAAVDLIVVVARKYRRPS
ncbi:MAG: hypothetical protein PUK29_03495 [Fibrobacter sp.]|nr:hypothetical protein [Fibrobacter sp.]